MAADGSSTNLLSILLLRKGQKAKRFNIILSYQLSACIHFLSPYPFASEYIVGPSGVCFSKDGLQIKIQPEMGSTKVATTLRAVGKNRLCLHTHSQNRLLPFPGRKMFFKMSGRDRTRPFD